MTEQELKYKIEEEIKKSLSTQDVDVYSGEDGSIVALIVRWSFNNYDLEKLQNIAKKYNLKLHFFVTAEQWYWVLIECTFRR
jgi:hypothetical protein